MFENLLEITPVTLGSLLGETASGVALCRGSAAGV